ncbi:acyl-CoA thioesterase [Helicobacter sp. MIT 05-5293]|uniref:acyl-CoA thioesterase n=1 Tax=Helicobacter sp. MIT 05-5293 TaxID=1548149 RepID=UPI00051CEC32|nr:thioesterase family protein [Helicobacter sp. MIT 05-5293]TLD81560.1 acyl-CoA thioesterase [Helicobacter sp. MIT 05-5293]
MSIYQVRIYFEDTDCGRIVYHTNYLKYCERARSELFFEHQSDPFVGDCGFVLKSIDAHFTAPARLGDLLEVRSEIISLKNVSLQLSQRIYKIYDALTKSACDEKVFDALITLAFIDVQKGKPQKITPQMLRILEKI